MESLPPALHDQGSSEEMGLAIIPRRSARPSAKRHGPDASGGCVDDDGARHLATALSAHRCPRLKCACSNDLKIQMRIRNSSKKVAFLAERIFFSIRIRLFLGMYDVSMVKLLSLFSIGIDFLKPHSLFKNTKKDVS